MRSLFHTVIYKLHDYFDRSFDRRHKIDTSGAIKIDKLGIESTHAEDANPFESTTTKAFVHAMKNLNVRYEDFVFIDVGSGKGRTLLLASSFPFKKIVGVEFSERLNKTAQNNIQIYKNKHQKCFDILSLYADAAEYEFPAENLIIYFYNPFREKLMKKVLDNIHRAIALHSVKVMVAYLNPAHVEARNQSPILRHKSELKLPKIFCSLLRTSCTSIRISRLHTSTQCYKSEIRRSPKKL